MNSTTTKLLDKYIPEKKTMKITERRKELNRIKEQRLVVRRRERICRGHREEHQLIPFKSERNRLNRMLFKAKIDVISNEVIKCGKDTKALFKLNHKITGGGGAEKRILYQYVSLTRTLQINFLILFWTKLSTFGKNLIVNIFTFHMIK